jgi:hypothetical protein
MEREQIDRKNRWEKMCSGSPRTNLHGHFLSGGLSTI